MVKKGEKGVPRTPETRIKIGVGARATRLSEIRACPEGCDGVFNSGNLASHTKKYHSFVCKIPECPGDIAKGLGYCALHYRIHAFCVKIGTTVEGYLETYKKQEGRCKICGRHGELQGTGVNRIHALVIDHCHETNRFRGLLCHKCNLGLGQFLDNPVSLQNALDYVRESE